MTLSALILLALKLSIALQVFSLGLKSEPGDLLYLPRRPGLLARSLTSMILIMPLFAAALVLMFALRPPVEIMLVAAALAPVPPMLPGKAIKSGGHRAYAVSLMATAALVAIASIPIMLAILQAVFHTPLQMSPLAVFSVMFMTVLLPLGAGVAVRAFFPQLAERFAQPLLAIATAMLAVGVIAILVVSARAILAQIGDGTLAALSAFVLVGLGVGHLLGGPSSSDRTVLSLSTASRHPGMAAAIATANFPEEKAAFAVLLLYALVGAVLSTLYLRWRKAHDAAPFPRARAH